MGIRTVAVIGGGAAGMMAAITAAREGCSVTVYERNDRLGKKILATGNGKCNLGNMTLSGREYYGGSEALISSCLERFGAEDTVRFFQGLGLMVKNKNGYLYPASEQAAVVLDVLRLELAALDVEVVTEAKVNVLHGGPDGLELGYRQERRRFDSVIIACGGKAAPGTGSDGSGYKLARQLGCRVTPLAPALVQLKCREEYCRAVAGVRADAQIRALAGGEEIACERGELQLTEYGISGIPVFQLSRTVNLLLRNRTDGIGIYHGRRYRDIEAEIDFLPDIPAQAYESFCRERRLLHGSRTVEEFFTGMLHKKIMLLLIKLAGLKPGALIRDADNERVNEVFRLCRRFVLHVTDSNSYEKAQVCAGGVALEEITEDMECRKVPGVFFAGEVLDVDGRCGGYNLQWAWTSGYLAGMAASGKRGVMEEALLTGPGGPGGHL